MSTLIEVVVDGLWREGKHNLAVRLVTPDGDPLPAWQPGAHIDLHLANGVTRQYSLTGSHRRLERYLICVARSAESRGGSRYIHETLRPGQRLMISLPRNQFALQTARHVTLLAAGIGITPLYSMARALAAQGKPFTLQYYLNRRENGALVAAIAGKLAPENVRIYSSVEGESPRENLAGRLRVPHRE
ncbi:TPA: ferredoxin reductase, partial [Klebsiella aerogenes]|nr:ferredoxin reductase [Klebsiella aerogenes]